MKKIILSCKIYIYFILIISCSYQANAQHIFASPNGSATGPGTSQTTPVNLDRARAIAKSYPNNVCIIYLANGIYPALSLDSNDSRAANATVVYTAMQPGGAIFQPEITLNRASFQPIPSNIQARIVDATAKTHVVQMSLASLNITDTAMWPAHFTIAQLKTPKFYNNGYPLPMSRYPSDPTANMTMRQVVTPGSGNSVPGGSFKYRDDRAKFWLNAINDGGLYLSGSWQEIWEIDVLKTLSVNTADSLITQSIGLNGGLGTQDPGRLPSGTEPYCALNLVEEINAEGQWSINFKTKMLYMWLPSTGTITLDGNSAIPAISATGVSNTDFVNLTIQGGSGNGVELHNCTNVQLAGSHISDCSGYGVSITDGSSCIIQSNDIDSVGAGGVIISTSTFTADQFAMKPSKHKVINNHIYSYAREAVLYSAAVDIKNALGTYVAYNKVHDCPHVGILYGGNNNTLEYNEVYDVVKKYSDMGAFYTWGGANVWTVRGNKLHHNYIHDAPLAEGLYGDNNSSGDISSYNIIEGVQMGIFDHEGYFDYYSNSILVNNVYPVTTMAEATSSPTYATHFNALQTLWNSSAAYKAAYPECADMVGPAGRNNAYSSRIWPSVTGCVFLASPGVLSNTNDNKIFTPSGAEDNSYTQTSNAFTTWSTVFQNNFRLNPGRTKPFVPFAMDSLTASGAFGMVGATDWHINRIGLHKDSYSNRQNLSSTKIQGIDPVITIKDTSINFKNPGIVTLTVGIKIPNAAVVVSSLNFFDNGKAITGLAITKNAVTYDSVAYIAQWTNPAVGTHSIMAQGNDGDGAYWQYNSNTVSFAITAGTQATADSSLKQLTLHNTDIDSAAKISPADSSRFNTAILSLFPNPASNLINISYNSSKAQGNTSVIVYDIMGRILLKKNVGIQQGPNQLALPVNNMPDGIYLLVLENQQNAITSQRFVIKH